MVNNIVRFDPFEDLARLQREMNNLFNDSRGEARIPRTRENTASSVWSPSVDVKEDESQIVVRVELPGVRSEDIDLELSGDTMTIRGEKKFEDEEKSGSYVRIERLYGRFQRSFTLNAQIDQDSIAASFKDGVLTVRLPKSQVSKRKKVEVVAG
jgi:HSP20 family protein